MLQREEGRLLEQFKEQSVKPPGPVITRWGTWLSAALYYNDYSNQLTTFVDAELVGNKTALLSKLRSTLQYPDVKS